MSGLACMLPRGQEELKERQLPRRGQRLREGSRRMILTTASWQIQKRLLYLENAEAHDSGPRTSSCRICCRTPSPARCTGCSSPLSRRTTRNHQSPSLRKSWSSSLHEPHAHELDSRKWSADALGLDECS